MQSVVRLRSSRMAPAVPEAGPALGPRRPRAGVDMGWVLRGLSIPLIKPDIRKMQKLYYWFGETAQVTVLVTVL